MAAFAIAGFGPAAQAFEPTARAAFSGIRADIRSLGLAAARQDTSDLPPPVVRDAPPLSEPPQWTGNGFRYGHNVAGRSQTEDFRHGISARAALKLQVVPVSILNRTGWSWSGRAGPLRWLGPIDGEGGELMLRLQRIPGAPRPEGLGRLHVGVHYTFE